MKFAGSILVSCVAGVAAHGHMTIPPSRNLGSLEGGASCAEGQCFWFSNNVEIPGNITLPDQYRTVNRAATQGSERDLYTTSPWRAPGTAPVYGSGCAAAGGGPTYYANGGQPPAGIAQGLDGLKLPPTNTTKWTRGSTAEVAWAIAANHGGGYSYRLCPKTAAVIDEACFQANSLDFAGEDSWIVQPDASKSKPFKRTTVTEGVYPKGSQWAMGPVPACNACDLYDTCGTPLPPVPGHVASAWDDQVNCYAGCDGAGVSKDNGACPDGTSNFPERIPGISGFGKFIWGWSILDLAQVPSHLEAGDYLLSWRWDCEESTQVWQNCADIQLV